MLVEGLGFVSLLGAGILAGEEFVICLGVRRPLASLDPQSEIRFRQALIYRLRVLIPTIFGVALLSGIATAVLAGFAPGAVFRWAGLALLVAFISVTLAGTVPINQAALTWQPAAPPDGWRAMINRWERLDIVRTCAAVGAFGLFLAAAMTH